MYEKGVTSPELSPGHKTGKINIEQSMEQRFVQNIKYISVNVFNTFSLCNLSL